MVTALKKLFFVLVEVVRLQLSADSILMLGRGNWAALENILLVPFWMG